LFSLGCGCVAITVHYKSFCWNYTENEINKQINIQQLETQHEKIK